jgi:glutamate-ammonia-ligase adenylyltransferase
MGVNVRAPNDLPSALRGRFEQVAERLGALPPRTLEQAPQVAASAVKVALASDFVLATLERDADRLIERLADPRPLTHEGLGARIRLGGLSEARAMEVLRRNRNIELARIIWRDIAGWADLETSFAETSRLADFSIRAALAFASHERRVSGHGRLPLLVLGMGKLGGEELNYSSDVDLVFLYPERDSDDSGDVGADQDRYRRLGQTLIRLLDHATGDGFVFRVDMRLRPFGASGPLVVSLPAFESYLIRHGRDWERYAYVKARLITGSRYRAEVFDEILTPFVYRRYLDYSVFDSLRQMKSLIAAEVSRRDLADNVKLGPGGIREIEFVVQAFQLVRGGRDPSLRVRPLLRALPGLAAARQLGEQAVRELSAAYRFLRKLENCLQAMADRQTHDLPGEPLARARLAYAMGEPSWEALEETLVRHRAKVEAQFSRVAWDTHASVRHADAAASIRGAWDGDSLAEAVRGAGIERAEEIARMLTRLRDGALYQRIDEPGRQRLAAAVARTVPMLAGQRDAAATLRRVLTVFEAVGRRSAYLSLLNENPSALERLLRLAGHSEFIVRQIAHHPLLLDELLDSRLFETPPSREELARSLRQYLANVACGDVEACLEAMRLFQRAAIFRIAVADRLGRLPLMKVSDRLTDTAELVLELALKTAWAETVARFGKPMCGGPAPMREAGFAIVGYGKLGGLELGYGSDLDLVFLHDSAGKQQETDGTPPLDNARFYARLVQRLLHFLTIQTSSGRLYEIDTRLRPSGRAGLMVASLENFGRYQRKEAWVWEHQALLRSRSVAGAPAVREAFENERRDILTHWVERARLREEIASMRRRMRAELSAGGPGRFDIKQDPGGLADIEFLVDYWVLANAEAWPELVEFPDNVRQLEALERTGLVSAERCAGLKEVYLALRQRTHQLALDDGGRVVEEAEFRQQREWVGAVWREVFG